jgi:hypothetical protein
MAMTVGDAVLPGGGDPGSPVFVDIVPLTGDDSYPDGGYDITALIQAKIGAGRTIVAVLQVGEDPADTWLSRWDRANGKLMLMTEALAQVSATTDVQTFANVDHLVISK